MGIKESIRPLLPPTSRAFLNRTDSLSESLDRQEARIEEVRGELSGQIACERRELDSILSCLRYVNLEYSVKLDQNPADILLAGWYGAENFGDELMLHTILQCLPEDSLSRVAVLLWDDFHYSADAIDPRVTILHYPRSTWDLDQLANHFATIVWGGGAIIDERQFDDDPSNINTGNLFIRLSKKMLARGKRVCCIGLSSNDNLSDEGYVRELSAIVAGSAHFSLRDPNSMAALASAGVDVSNIESCEDIVFANEGLAQLPKREQAEKGSPVRIAVVPLTISSLLRHYRHVLKDISASLSATEKDFELHLVPFLNEQGGHDTRYCEELIRSMDDLGVIVEPYHRSAEDYHFESYDLVISYKYHSALISLVQGVQTLCVFADEHPHYRNKMSHLVELLADDDHLVPSSAFEDCAPSLVTKFLGTHMAPKPCAQFLENQRLWLKNICSRVIA